MPSRHSKNNTSRGFFTHHERQTLDNWGTREQRLSKDSFKNFFDCGLCLQRAEEPVSVSPPVVSMSFPCVRELLIPPPLLPCSHSSFARRVISTARDASMRISWPRDSSSGNNRASTKNRKPQRKLPRKPRHITRSRKSSCVSRRWRIPSIPAPLDPNQKQRMPNPEDRIDTVDTLRTRKRNQGSSCSRRRRLDSSEVRVTPP